MDKASSDKNWKTIQRVQILRLNLLILHERSQTYTFLLYTNARKEEEKKRRRKEENDDILA